MPKVKPSDPRREARMAALQSLFAADIRGNRGESSGEACLEWLSIENSLQAWSMELADALARGVTTSRNELDQHIQRELGRANAGLATFHFGKIQNIVIVCRTLFNKLKRVRNMFQWNVCLVDLIML